MWQEIFEKSEIFIMEILCVGHRNYDFMITYINHCIKACEIDYGDRSLNLLQFKHELFPQINNRKHSVSFKPDILSGKDL